MYVITQLSPLSSDPPSTTTTTIATGSDAVAADLSSLLWFGAAVLALFTVIVVLTGGLGASTSRFRTIARVYALLGVAGFGVALAFAGLADSARTAAFTLLGTIAGYLAGASGSTTMTSTTRGLADQEKGETEVASTVL